MRDLTSTAYEEKCNMHIMEVDYRCSPCPRKSCFFFLTRANIKYYFRCGEMSCMTRKILGRRMPLRYREMIVFQQIDWNWHSNHFSCKNSNRFLRPVARHSGRSTLVTGHNYQAMLFNFGLAIYNLKVEENLITSYLYAKCSTV